MKSLLLAVALIHATVFVGEGPPVEDATVLIDGGKIVAVGPRVRVPRNAEVIDVASQWVTPGLVDASSRLGLVDVSLEATAVEGTLGEEADPVRAALRVADTWNGASFAIPVARGGGITSVVAVPEGGVIAGQSVFVDLLERGALVDPAAGLHVRVGASSSELAGARSRALLTIREAFTDAALARSNAAAYSRRRLRELSISAADVEVLDRAVTGRMPVVFSVDRATDIRTVLEIAREHRLKAILIGAAEGWKVADEIARAGVPVLVDPLRNLPRGFDALAAREDNALQMHRAGVKVAFSLRREIHLAHRLRWLAGNAVAQGFAHEHALAAITRIPAEIFGQADRGVVRPGAVANLVVWTGDPLEVTSWPLRMFIRGEPVPLHSRQDQLTERYAR